MSFEFLPGLSWPLKRMMPDLLRFSQAQNIAPAAGTASSIRQVLRPSECNPLFRIPVRCTAHRPAEIGRIVDLDNKLRQPHY
jgi:hypothetical protein